MRNIILHISLARALETEALIEAQQVGLRRDTHCRIAMPVLQPRHSLAHHHFANARLAHTEVCRHAANAPFSVGHTGLHQPEATHALPSGIQPKKVKTPLVLAVRILVRAVLLYNKHFCSIINTRILRAITS